MKLKTIKLGTLLTAAAVLIAAWMSLLGWGKTAEARPIPINPINKPTAVWSAINPINPINQSTTITLYDGSLGGTPDDQSLLYLNLPPNSATNTESGGVTTLDTTIVGMGAYAGYFGDETTVNEIPVLDRTTGYTLTFTIQVESEAHGNDNRAGFSVIVLSDDNKGIEMGFWENEIWVQDDDAVDPGNLFTHAEGVPYSTTTSLTTYNLFIYNDTYTLTVGNSTILSGRLRDYTNFSGPIDPYETPNFIFLGDNTTSAMGRTRLSYIAVMTADDYFVYLPFLRRT